MGDSKVSSVDERRRSPFVSVVPFVVAVAIASDGAFDGSEDDAQEGVCSTACGAYARHVSASMPGRPAAACLSLSKFENTRRGSLPARSLDFFLKVQRDGPTALVTAAFIL